MSWQVIWSDKSLRQLEKINKKDAQQIYDSVLGCAGDPFMAVIRLANSPFYRMRVGNYRIIMDLQQSKLLVFVIELDHRKNVYKKR